MITLKNNTKSVSKIGYVVSLDPNDRNAFVYVSAGAVKAIGVVTEAVAYRKPCKIATLGDTAKVFVAGNVVKGNILRTVKSIDRASLGTAVIAGTADAPYLRIGEALNSARGLVSCVLDFSYLQSDGLTITWDDITGKPVDIYASIGIDSEPIFTAASYTEVSGATIASGTVVDTRTVNQTYLQVEENTKFDIQFTFTGLTGHPAQVLFNGRYKGNTAHEVWLYIWNYSGVPAWERVTAAAKDFISSATDYALQFNLVSSADYISGGECKLRIYHNSAAAPTHDMYIDYIAVIQETQALAVAGTYYQATGFTEEAKSDNITVDAAAGSITIPITGDYENLSTISFNATGSSKIELSLFVNGAKLVTLWRRHMNSDGDIGSAASTAIREFTEGDVITWRYLADVNDAYMSVIAMRCSIKKLSNF